MIQTEEAIWRRVDLQWLLTLIHLNNSDVTLQDRSGDVDGRNQASTICLSNNFGGSVSAPASSLAVCAIGNAFAKASIPTTAGVTPVYSSADCI